MSFAQINKIAIQNILLNEIALKLLVDGKNSQNYKEIDNHLKDLQIFNREQETNELKEIVEYFAQHFTGTDL